MNETEILLQLTGTLLLGVSAQWLAWRLKLPSILLLLLVGLLAGPLLHWLDPGTLLGTLLFPFVSLSVALILFEGGLTLRLAELRGVGTTVLRLISIGVISTWVIATLAARFVVGLPFDLSLLLGAILTVTGPTVVGPLLRHIRPQGASGSVLKWEGILVDPVGAILAVLTFQAIQQGRIADATSSTVLLRVVGALFVGMVVGVAFATILVLGLRKRLVPDALHNAFTLMLVLVAFAVANQLHHESGLLAVTLMGIALANQRRVPVRHILQFKENLRVLLISTLFILLAARLQREDFAGLSLSAVLFLATIILIARPVGVALSTLGSKLTRRERLFLAWMAPRGIVAAAVTSVFAHRLSLDPRFPEADRLVPLVFVIIIGTVIVYGLTGGPLARRLGLAATNPQGALIVGANPIGRALGMALADLGQPVLIVDSNYTRIGAARMDGLPTWYGNILSETTLEELDLAGIGRLIALTPNDDANSLAALHLGDLFGRDEVYQLSPARSTGSAKGNDAIADLRGRNLFGENLDYLELERRLASGWKVRTTLLTEHYTFADHHAKHGGQEISLFMVAGGRITPFTVHDPPLPGLDQTLISLVPPALTASASKGDNQPAGQLS